MSLVLVPVQIIRDIIGAFVIALSDYSTDQRGDVGSWIRSCAMEALGLTIATAAKKGLEIVPQSLFEEVVGGIVKQAVEKLEPTRTAAALALARLRSAEAQRTWTWENHETLLFTPTENE